MHELKDWITAEEAADLLAMSVQAMGRHAGPAGSGKPIRTKNNREGRYLRYETVSLLAFLARRNQEAKRADEDADPTVDAGDAPRTVIELRKRVKAWAKEYYTNSREWRNIDEAMAELVAVAGRKPPRSLTCVDFYGAQRQMESRRLARTTINAKLRRMRFVAKWAARPPRRWISAQVATEAGLVEPLKVGRTQAPEPEPIRPVAWDDVSATMAVADLELATAIELLWYTGMRPGELVRMRLSELHERDDGIIVYTPAHHKTAHFGHKRRVYLGAHARSAVDSWLERVRHHPASVSRFRRQLRVNLPGAPGAIEDRDSAFRWLHASAFYRAIRRVNHRHGLTHWAPLQVRHAFATRMRAKYGLEVTQILMGHKHASTTEIYAERDESSAIRAIRELG